MTTKTSLAPYLTAQEEARRLNSLFDGRPAELLALLGNQLSVLKQHAQMLMGLCGLVITVTGFSGAHMVRSGSTAAALMVLGIGSVLVAALLCLRALTQVRWVTKSLSDNMLHTVMVVLERRDRQHALLSWAAIFVGLGLAAYLAAVAVAALGGQVRTGLG